MRSYVTIPTFLDIFSDIAAYAWANNEIFRANLPRKMLKLLDPDRSDLRGKSFSNTCSNKIGKSGCNGANETSTICANKTTFIWANSGGVTSYGSRIWVIKEGFICSCKRGLKNNELANYRPGLTTSLPVNETAKNHPMFLRFNFRTLSFKWYHRCGGNKMLHMHERQKKRKREDEQTIWESANP